MRDIKISVIMPVYRVEEYVGKAIESILGQTFMDFEFLIVEAYWVAEEMLDGAVRLGLPQDALFACNLILQLANYCYVCVAGLPEADRQTAFACCCLLYRRWAAKLPDPRTLPYAVRLAQRALEQADYGLWQLQGRLFQLIN